MPAVFWVPSAGYSPASQNWACHAMTPVIFDRIEKPRLSFPPPRRSPRAGPCVASGAPAARATGRPWSWCSTPWQRPGWRCDRVRGSMRAGRPSLSATCASLMRLACSALAAGASWNGEASSNSTWRRKKRSADLASEPWTSVCLARLSKARTPAAPPRTTGASTPAPPAASPIKQRRAAAVYTGRDEQLISEPPRPT